MVRTVKAKAVRSLVKGERAVLLPGTTGAEPWELWILGGQAQAECVQVCASPLDNRLRRNATLALPVSQVFCLPLWLNETDAKQFAGIISLQLELRGLQPRGNNPVVFDWSVVAQEGARTLVIAGVLPASLSPEMQTEAYEIFDLSARYLPFPENALTLWQEQDHLAVAITRGPQLVYYQTLPEPRITQRVLQDLTCIRATLEMQDILTSLQQVILWTEVSPAELAAMRVALQLPVGQAERPAPRPPSPVWKLTPAVVSQAKKDRETRRWRTRVISIALVVYLMVIALVISQYFVTSYRVDQLRRWQVDHAQALALIHDTETAWGELRLVVDENNYPLELLSQTQEAIPADQLHLTLFEGDGEHLLIKGEAKNASAAFQFFEALKNNPHLADYTLEMAQPTIASNDLAKFTINGTYMDRK
jgi:hypothetical protein